MASEFGVHGPIFSRSVTIILYMHGTHITDSKKIVLIYISSHPLSDVSQSMNVVATNRACESTTVR